jgi:hypothetical protein
MDLGGGPSKKRYRTNDDHRPFAEAVEELPSVLPIFYGQRVRHSVFILTYFHEETS